MNLKWKIQVSFISMVILMLTGCLYESDTQLIAKSDRVTPLEPESYYGTSELDAKGLSKKQLEANFTQRELSLISKKVYFPDVDKGGMVFEEDDCYFGLKKDGSETEGYIFEQLKSDYYLIVTTKKCSDSEKSEKDGFRYYVGKIDRHGRLFYLEHPKSKAFENWLDNLNENEKQKYNISMNGELKNSKAMIEFAKIHIDEFESTLLLVPFRKVSIYQEEIDIARKIKTLLQK